MSDEPIASFEVSFKDDIRVVTNTPARNEAMYAMMVIVLAIVFLINIELDCLQSDATPLKMTTGPDTNSIHRSNQFGGYLAISGRADIDLYWTWLGFRRCFVALEPACCLDGGR